MFVCKHLSNKITINKEEETHDLKKFILLHKNGSIIQGNWYIAMERVFISTALLASIFPRTMDYSSFLGRNLSYLIVCFMFLEMTLIYYFFTTSKRIIHKKISMIRMW